MRVLISDDLSVLHPDLAGGTPLLYAGRHTLRLFPRTASWLASVVPVSQEPYPMGNKVVVAPPQVAMKTAIPLRRVVLLGYEPGPLPSDAKVAALTAQLYRAVRVAQHTGHARRLLLVAAAARHLDIVGEPPLERTL